MEKKERRNRTLKPFRTCPKESRAVIANRSAREFEMKEREGDEGKERLVIWEVWMAHALLGPY